MDINGVNSNFNMPQSSAGAGASRFEKTQDTSPKTTTEINKQNEENIKKDLKKTIENLNSQMDKLGTDLKFGFNDKIDIMYVNVHEKSSGKLIRKFPTEEAMKLAEHMKEFVGMLFDKKG